MCLHPTSMIGEASLKEDGNGGGTLRAAPSWKNSKSAKA